MSKQIKTLNPPAFKHSQVLGVVALAHMKDASKSLCDAINNIAEIHEIRQDDIVIQMYPHAKKSNLAVCMIHYNTDYSADTMLSIGIAFGSIAAASIFYDKQLPIELQIAEINHQSLTLA